MEMIKHYRQLVGIAKGWASANLPGWNDDTHRDMLTRHGATVMDGRVSASTLNLAQLGAVLDDYERRGWPRQRRVFRKTHASKEVPPRIAHIVRLWGKLGQAGKVERSTRPALLAFCGRQVGRSVSDLDSLAPDECQKVTEALKSWLGRAR
ncbi:regulatory protein GemA [Burkholderia metallica]|uniref:regulatory protein GemA n=1 Tax=Burkholderia metallica TaxID=488729 RepID=UPI00157A56A5|nr:regulatory protein GemA [Burkholderia metallica]